MLSYSIVFFRNFETPDFMIESLKKSNTRQKTLKEFHIPQLTDYEKRKFFDLLSLYYYDTATSFLRIENNYLLHALQILRPDVTLPSRKQLGGNLLDTTYDNVKQCVDQLMEKENYYATLVTDGWTNIARVPIITYCSSCSSESIFLESIATNGQSHNSTFLAEDISRIIKKYPCLTGVCTDNAAANRGAWRLLEQDHLHIFCYGCQAHALHLLVRDLFEASTEGHPFANIHQLIEYCLEISKIFVQVQFNSQSTRNLIQTPLHSKFHVLQDGELWVIV